MIKSIRPDFQRNIGRYQEPRADAGGPVTRNGRGRTVLILRRRIPAPSSGVNRQVLTLTTHRRRKSPRWKPHVPRTSAKAFDTEVNLIRRAVSHTRSWPRHPLQAIFGPAARGGQEKASRIGLCDRSHDRRTRGQNHVTVLPSRIPNRLDARLAIEILTATKRRLGLYDARSWVRLTEANRFILGLDRTWFHRAPATRAASLRNAATRAVRGYSANFMTR